MHCNASHIRVTEKGWFGDIKVWYHLKGIANIVSLKMLKNRHCVTYDSEDRNGIFKVYTTKGIVEFVPHENRLHYLDLKEKEEAGVALVTMIRDNFKGYRKKQEEGAIKAQCFQAML